MKAVEQKSDDLNQIAEDYLTTPGDARDAWHVIGACVAAGRELPEWVKAYLLAASGKIAAVERTRDGSDAVATALGFHLESADQQTKPKWAYYDSLTVYSVIVGWQRKAADEGRKLSLATCLKRYVDERLKGTGDEQTVKTTYYRGKAIAENEMRFLDVAALREA